MNDCEHCDCDGSRKCCLCGAEKPMEDEHEYCHPEWHRCDGGGKGEYDRYIEASG